MATNESGNTGEDRSNAGSERAQARPPKKKPTAASKAGESRTGQSPSSKPAARRKPSAESAEKPASTDKKATARGTGESSSSGSSMSTAKAARAAMDQLKDLTDRDPEGIIGIQKDDDGWTVTVEVVETRRVPNTSDVLAEYEVTVDSSAELVSYSRGPRYVRGRARD